MSIIYVAAAAVIGVLLSSVVKRINPQFGIYVVVMCGLIILLMVVDGFKNLFDFSNKFMVISGISDENFKLLIKAIGIGYIAQFTSDICFDSGESSLGEKVELAGKIIILTMCLPLIENLFLLIEKIMGTHL